ncbi:hypothetical protein RE428_48160 [Marinobacter nanhaiticus D15-8W]|uniref:Uncharacterized protein n=1 Tax=Marinobacter nanhaiticus D15-8W TaxID=626887 RepID=N6WUW8_9GAMM|nr:hypothetical protein [Marinobacter nanhaiticus]ENO15356.1 hypothetical protein J057_08396 [Marinobacter nanhaiticus D15-8W]BES73798.1 hypothetical protein RE428_48160 [Marinobacter nanhaiticus D15-8W]
MMAPKELTHRDWWLGMADLASAGAAATAGRLEQVHLSIADETFNVLARIPVTRPVSQRVRQIHHGISTLSYRSVSAGALAFNMWLARQVSKD